MKTRSVLILAAILTNIFVQAQSPSWAWAKRSVSASNANGNGIFSDYLGNVYVTGNFQANTITFGSTVLTNDTTNGSNDIFVVKYDANGNVVWAKSVGGTDNDNGYKISVDHAGCVYVVGYFGSRKIIFGSDTLVLSTGILGNQDIFILKFNPDGTPRWGRCAGGNDYDEAADIALDINANVFITGMYESPTLIFGTYTLINATSTGGVNDVFVAKYDSLGNVIWATSAGGTSYEYGTGINVDPSGNVLLTGTFQSSSITFGTNTLLNAGSGSPDVFTVKYDPSGNVLWAVQTGGFSYESSSGISTDGAGNVFVTGSFQTPSIPFGTSTLINTLSSTADVFILKFDALGNAGWAKSMGGLDSENSTGISVSSSGDSFITGFFGSQTFASGNDTLTNVNSNNGIEDLFVVKYDPLGNAIWAKSAGGTDYDYGMGISVDQNGYISIVGSFSSTSIIFGTTTLPNSTSGSADVFTAQLGACSAPSANICMVTVDSLSHNNIIVWDKTSMTNVDSFIVYREITTNVYKRIGALPYTALSQMVDTVRTQYFPNTGDPNAGTYRYKLQVLDSCGNYSAMGPYHNTIFMSNNNGTFSWPQLYTIENGPNPVNAYVLMRDDNNTGSWHAVNSVAGTQQSVTDPAYSSWASTANWRIQTLWGITCTPTFRYSNNIQSSLSSSHSNLLHTLTSVNELSINNLLNIYPNPSSGKFNIEFSNSEIQINGVEIYDAIGQKIYSENNTQTNSSCAIDVSSKPNGIYFVCVTTAKGTARKKIIVQK